VTWHHWLMLVIVILFVYVYLGNKWHQENGTPTGIVLTILTILFLSPIVVIHTLFKKTRIIRALEVVPWNLMQIVFVLDYKKTACAVFLLFILFFTLHTYRCRVQ